LKNLIADPNDKDNKGYSMRAERKFVSSYSFYARCAFITASQEYPKLKNYNDGGWFRRFLTIRIRKNPVFNEEIFQAPLDHLDDLFSWCLEQDLDQIIKHFKYLNRIEESDDHWITRANKDVKILNNKYWQYIDQCIDVDPESFVSAKTVFNNYKEWCREESNEVPGTQATFGKLFLQALKERFGLTEDCKLRRNDGQYYKGIIIRLDQQ